MCVFYKLFVFRPPVLAEIHIPMIRFSQYSRLQLVCFSISTIDLTNVRLHLDVSTFLFNTSLFKHTCPKCWPTWPTICQSSWFRSRCCVESSSDGSPVRTLGFNGLPGSLGNPTVEPLNRWTVEPHLKPITTEKSHGSKNSESQVCTLIDYVFP